MIGLILFKFIQRRRSRSHQAHIALQNVDELRELVQACLSQELSDLRDAGIILHLEHQAIHFILCHQLLLTLLSINIHGTELVHFENTAVSPHSLLGEEYRTGRIQLDDGCQYNGKNRENHRSNQSSHNIHQTLQQELSEGSYLIGIGNHVELSELGQHPLRSLLQLKHGDLKVDGQPHRRNVLHLIAQALLRFPVRADNHFIQRRGKAVIHQLLPPSYNRNAVHIGSIGTIQHNDSLDFITAVPDRSHLLHQTGGHIPWCDEQKLPCRSAHPVEYGQIFFIYLMYNEHQHHIDDDEQKQHSTGVFIDNSGEIQREGSSGQRHQIHLDDLKQLLKRSSQKHLLIEIFIQIDYQKHHQKNEDQHLHIRWIVQSTEKFLMPDVVCDTETEHQHNTIDGDDDQILQI